MRSVRSFTLAGVVALSVGAVLPSSASAADVVLSGTIKSAAGEAMGGVTVSAKAEAQRTPFFQPRDGEGIRIRESQGTWNKSMAVRVRLDNCHHASACRMTAHHGEIGSQRAGVDHRAYQPRHLTIPSP